ncbi:MAG: cupin domain-containing protein, partial [Actinomycetota bacterium]|nr:cupin domain-containing protein [Actinomycetota bacterium]
SRPSVHRADPDALSALLDLDGVDQLLTSSALRTPALRLAKDGNVLASSRFTRSGRLGGTALTGLVDVRKVLNLFDDGATVVLQGLHRYWPPLTELIRDLELTLGHPCQANAYLTPPSSQGFALHTDNHDVFVLQTSGRKLWEIHDGDDRQEVPLEPGTSMYLPAGTPHAARTRDQASLHVTVGINQLTWRHLLDTLTKRALGDDELDAALPAGYIDDPAVLSNELRPRLDTLAAAIAAVDPTEVAEGQVQDFLTSRPPHLRGGLGDRLAVNEITDETGLARRPGSVCLPVVDDDRLRVLLGDRELRVPLRLGPAIEHVRAHDRLRPVDLSPWLDDQSRLVLVRRLVREGLLQVAG